MDKISVIIPCYNEDFELLKKCVQSVKEQNMNTEIIVVDDGSDEPVAFADNDVKVVGAEHKGAAAARNYGLTYATGDYIFFLDADSILLPGGLKILFNMLEYFPDRDFSYGKYYFFTNEKAMITLPWEQVNPTMGWNPNILKQNNYISTMALVRRGALPEKPFDESILRYHDWDLWLTMVDEEKMGCGVSHYIFKTLQRKDGLTGSQPDDLWRTEVQLKHKLPKVALFTLTRDRYDYTKDTVRSVRQKAGYPFFWLCVDNGSVTEQPFEKFNAVFRLEENRGLKWGTKKALQLLGTPDNTEYDFVCKIDNDVEALTQGFLKTLLRANMIMSMRQGPGVCVSPIVEGLNNEPVREDTVSIDGIGYSAMHHLGGICCMSTAQHWLNFQACEYPSFLAKGQDTAFSEFTKQNQGNMYYIENCRIKHMEGTEEQKKYPTYFDRKAKEEAIVVQ